MSGALPAEPVEVVEQESYEFGRLWPDGTFQSFGSYHSEKSARKQFDENSYQLKDVPEALRPVLGRQRSTKRVEIFKAEPVEAEEIR